MDFLETQFGHLSDVFCGGPIIIILMNCHSDKYTCAYYIIISIIAAVLMTNVIFGFLSAVGGPLLPPIIIEFLGEHNLAVGYGILLIFEGVGSFAGPPLAGIYINSMSKIFHFLLYFLTKEN